MRSSVLGAALLAMMLSLNAKPIVVGRLGQTVDVSHIVPHIQASGSDVLHFDKAKIMNSMFSQQSSLLSPGRVTKRTSKKVLTQMPMYIVGTDKKSIAWLTHYKSRLQTIKAIGFLVNVRNKADYDRFVSLTGVTLSVVNGDPLAKRFSLQHYPVLITQHVIEQ